MVIASGEAGELGIMPRHAPLITRLRCGQVRVVREDGDEELLYVSGGLMEVQPHVVTILADVATRAADLDEAAAEAARQSAERTLAENDSPLDYAKAHVEIAQAEAKLATLKRFRQVRKKLNL